MLKTLANSPTALTICTLVACTAPTGTRAQDATPDIEDLRMHLYCDQLSVTRMLNFEEASVCMSAYQRIKLSFVPGMDLSDYVQLSAVERAAVNLQGYEGFAVWAELNSEYLQNLREELQLELIQSSDRH